MSRTLTLTLSSTYRAGELVKLWHVHGLVELEEHTDQGVHLRGLLPQEMAGRFEPFALRGTVKTPNKPGPDG